MDYLTPEIVSGTQAVHVCLEFPPKTLVFLVSRSVYC